MGPTKTDEKKRCLTRAEKEMNPELRVMCAEARLLLATEGLTELSVNHRLGKIASQVRNKAVYGVNAVALLAEAAGVKPGLLYDAAKVWDTWPDWPEIAEFRTRKDKYGRRIRFGHLVEIAREDSEDRRRELLDECFRLGLTVNQVRQRIRERRATQTTKSHSPQPLTLIKSLNRSAQRYLDAAAGLDQGTFRQLREAIANKAIDSTKKEQAQGEQIAQCLARHEQIVKLAQQFVDGLGQVLQTAQGAAEEPDDKDSGVANKPDGALQPDDEGSDSAPVTPVRQDPTKSENCRGGKVRLFA